MYTPDTGTDPFLDFVDAYSGKQETIDFINGRVDAANTQITTTGVALRQSSNSVSEALARADVHTPLSRIPEWHVDAPEFDADRITSEEPPSAEKFSGLTLDEIDISPIGATEIDCNIEGDNIPDPELKYSAAGNIPKAPDPMHGILAPDTDIIFEFEEYTDQLLEFLSNKVISELEDSPDGIANLETNIDTEVAINVKIVDPAIEQAVYDRAKYRNRSEAQDARTLAERTIQNRGFTMPPGALSAMLATIARKSADAEADLNRDIIASRIDLEQKRTGYEIQKAGVILEAQGKQDVFQLEYEGLVLKFRESQANMNKIYMDAGTKIEELLSNIFLAQKKFEFDAEKETVLANIQIYEKRVDAAKTIMDIYKVEMDAVVAQIKAEADYNDGLIKVFQGQIEAVNSRINQKRLSLDAQKTAADIENLRVMSEISVASAQNQRLQALAQIYMSEVQAYSSRIDGLKTAETLDLTRYEIESQAQGVEITSAVSAASLEIDSALKKVTARLDMIKNYTNIYGSIISSALNSINSSASYGFSGKAGISSSHQDSTSVSEKFGFTYTGSAEDVGSPTGPNSSDEK